MNIFRKALNNPFINPVGVFGGKAIKGLTGQLGIGGRDGLSYEDQLKIGAVIGAVALTGGAPAPAVGGLLGAGSAAAPVAGAGATGAGLMGGLKSVGTAAGAAGAVKGLLQGQGPPPVQMSQGNPAGPQTIEQIYQASQQATQDQINQAMQARMQRMQMWG